MNPNRLDFVRRVMGIRDTILVDQPEAVVRGLSNLTGGDLAEVVIDATGSPKSMSSALELCAFAGRLVYVGITQADLVFPHAPVMHRRELTLLASRNALPGDFTRIIDLIETGRIDTKPWITHEAGFDELIPNFPRWLEPDAGVIKAVVAVE